MAVYSECPAREQGDLSVDPFHVWKTDDGTCWTAFYRGSDGIVLRFPRLSDFTVSQSGESVVAHPVPGVGSGTLRHLYLNQVLPLALSAQGKLAFHASCVLSAHGAIAFLAESGEGKSTLAASFAAGGNPFLSDDSLVLEFREQCYFVLPGDPSVRLWADSEEEVVPETAASAQEVDYTSKARISAGDALRHAAAPARLTSIYVLGVNEEAEIRFTRLGPTSAVAALVAQSFQLDVQDKRALETQLHATVGLCEKVGVFQVDYPRRYDRLEDVKRAILGHAGKTESQ